MPTPLPTYPSDRFDELPTAAEGDARRVGAHRAEQPRMRRGRIVLWAAVATVLLVAVGILGTLWAGGRFGAAPTTPVVPTSGVTATPVIDTSYTVLVLNATTDPALGGSVSADVIAAGWSADDVTAGEAGSHDFAETTVFYATAEDEGAARGLAQAIGGADIEFSEAYQDGEELKQLVIVLGADRVAG
jgi:hypothetical protein